MQSALDRRQAIVDAMIMRRTDTIPNLAHEFNVSLSTIRRDLCILSQRHPIVTVRGRSGGVCYTGDKTLGKCPLSAAELEFLFELQSCLSSEKGLEMSIILHKLMESWTSD